MQGVESHRSNCKDCIEQLAERYRTIGELITITSNSGSHNNFRRLIIDNIISLLERVYCARFIRGESIERYPTTKEHRSNIVLDDVPLAVLKFSRVIKIIADY